MLLSISSALGTAMLPRMSYLIANGEKDKFEQLYRKSMRFMVGISLPITLGLIFTAPILINLFAGSTYHDAIFTLQLLSPIVLAISMWYTSTLSNGQSKYCNIGHRHWSSF